MLPVLSPLNTSASLLSALTPTLTSISSNYPSQLSFSLSNVTEWDSFYDWWIEHINENYAGLELVVGSRLLGADALLDTEALETALKGLLPTSEVGQIANFYLLGGKGIADAVPRGGSNAVNPAWRKAVVHAGMSYPSFLSLFPLSAIN